MAKLISGSIRQSRNDPATWETSMAKAIEKAFLDEWPYAMEGQPKPAVNDQMRLLFVAIAKGVVQHLETQQEAIKVTVQTSHSHTHGTSVNIETQIDP